MKECQRCKYKITNNFYSTDGWDRMEDWCCSKLNNKVIQGAVEWHEEKKINTPIWCPIYGKKILQELRDAKLKRIIQ